jgi:5-methylcytosine-specific restriction endonuclease McrA
VKNKERIRSHNKAYLRTEKGKLNHNLASVRRRTLKNNAINTLTKLQWEIALDFFSNTCAYCGKVDKLTVEHFIPLSTGGSTELCNIIPICKSCNSSKKNTPFEVWYCRQNFFSLERLMSIYDFINQNN